MNYAITKEIQFDAGHRVPEHKSKCRNPHGHRYRVETCVGAHELVSSGSAEGMVLDFGDVKTILMERVHDVLDHGFIIYEKDWALRKAMMEGRTYEGEDYNWKCILFPYIPTAENIARWIFEEIEDPIKYAYNEHAYLTHVRVWETPTSTAVYTGAYTE